MAKMTEEQMGPAKTLAYIQSQIRAPKGQFNAFGKYHYRSAEDIIEAVKQVINPLGYWLLMTDEIALIGERYYVQSTVTLTNGLNSYVSKAYAREEESKKGMDGSQVTGAAASYARKYALSALFCLDNGQADSDSTNTHGASNDEKATIADEWKQEINACKSVDELGKLYKSNQQAFDADPTLKKLLTLRKQQL
jgi:hypothetical protein